VNLTKIYFDRMLVSETNRVAGQILENNDGN
jgi:hypothetical protein